MNKEIPPLNLDTHPQKYEVKSESLTPEDKDYASEKAMNFASAYLKGLWEDENPLNI